MTEIAPHVARPAIDRIDVFFSRIEKLPRGRRWFLAIALYGSLTIFFVAAVFASLAFILPIWLYLLSRAPQWLLPLFLIGPVGFATVAYLVVRLNLWQHGELKPWSHRRLLGKIVREFGGLMVCGHIAAVSYIFFRMGYITAAATAFVAALGLLAFAFNWYLWIFSPYAPRQIEETLFPKPETPGAVVGNKSSSVSPTEAQKLERKNNRIAFWVLLFCYFIPLALILFVFLALIKIK